MVDDPNIFDMYVENGYELGFWVMRTTWRNICEQIIHVGPFTGPAPDYGNPTVTADIYDRHTGKLNKRTSHLSGAATYKTWRRIDPPSWWR